MHFKLKKLKPMWLCRQPSLDAELNWITLCYSFELIELHYYCSFIVSVCRKSWDRYILFFQNLLQNLIEWSPESERYFSDLTLLGYQNESLVLRQKEWSETVFNTEFNENSRSW